MAKEKQVYVKPFVLSDDEYVKYWLEKQESQKNHIEERYRNTYTIDEDVGMMGKEEYLLN